MMAAFNLIEPVIETYCETHSTPENDLLYRINRVTNIEVINPRMLAGQLQGQFLTMISKMIRPQRILEIGTFTGYSTICLAEGLPPTGRLHTIDINVELEDRILHHIQQWQHPERIILHIGDALQIIDTLHETWDLIFIDAEKKDYPAYYDKLVDRLRPGGFMLADNALWNGKIIRQADDSDRDTTGIRTFNDRVQRDRRVHNLLLPFRDGIMMIEKL